MSRRELKIVQRFVVSGVILFVASLIIGFTAIDSVKQFDRGGYEWIYGQKPKELTWEQRMVYRDMLIGQFLGGGMAMGTLWWLCRLGDRLTKPKGR